MALLVREYVTTVVLAKRTGVQTLQLVMDGKDWMRIHSYGAIRIYNYVGRDWFCRPTPPSTELEGDMVAYGPGTFRIGGEILRSWEKVIDFLVLLYISTPVETLQYVIAIKKFHDKFLRDVFRYGEWKMYSIDPTHYDGYTCWYQDKPETEFGFVACHKFKNLPNLDEMSDFPNMGMSDSMHKLRHIIENTLTDFPNIKSFSELDMLLIPLAKGIEK